MQAFEQLDVWKRSCRLSADLYDFLNACKNLGLKDQICRSALSIPSNIAEGYERNSSKEFARSLKIAKGSCGELRTQLYIGIEAGFLDKVRAKKFIQTTGEISKMLQGLISKVSTKSKT
ncbi:MAG: four helix bundle protein [Pseudomonadota bacterium]